MFVNEHIFVCIKYQPYIFCMALRDVYFLRKLEWTTGGQFEYSTYI